MHIPSLLLAVLSHSLVAAQKSTPSLSGAPIDLTGNNVGSAYPRANYLSNGNILAAYTAFPPGTNNQVLTLVTSSDNGLTWSRTGTAASKSIAAGTLDNPYPFQLPSGRILLAFRNHDIDSAGKFVYYRITLSYSDDLGANWKYLSDAMIVDASPDFENGIWEPLMRLGVDGTLQMYYSHERAAEDQDNVYLTSADGGATWSKTEIPVSGSNHNGRDGMVGVAGIREGNGTNLIAVFETNTNAGPFSIYAVSSSNGGATWTNRRLVYTASTTGRHAGAPQVVNVGGTLVVSFMTDEDVAASSWNWPIVAASKMLVSVDGGLTWKNKLQVFAPNSQWPSLLALRDEDAFLYLTSQGNVKAQKVTLS
ncbi:glycoside hydrolase family 93 protein [Cadophora sp. DSE1049]|nr:glycoside hydrolase family 93 protein [Cadophora sp. DSE1049]